VLEALGLTRAATPATATAASSPLYLLERQTRACSFRIAHVRHLTSYSRRARSRTTATPRAPQLTTYNIRHRPACHNNAPVAVFCYANAIIAHCQSQLAVGRLIHSIGHCSLRIVLVRHLTSYSRPQSHTATPQAPQLKLRNIIKHPPASYSPVLQYFVTIIHNSSRTTDTDT